MTDSPTGGAESTQPQPPKRKSGWPKGRLRNDGRPPKGWDTVEAFLVEVDAYCRPRRLVTTLARVLGVSDASLRRWLAREKLPSSATRTLMARWYRSRLTEDRRAAKSAGTGAVLP